MATRRSAPVPPAHVDFIIVTALEEERDAVLAKLRGAQRLDKGDDDIHTFYFARVTSRRRDRTTYNVILTTLLDMGPITATAQAVAVVNRWHPRFVLLAGIACGVRNVVSHGDLLIATQVADYTLGKQVKGRRQIRWSAYPCGASLLDSAIHVDRKWEKDIGVERPGEGAPRRHKGVVASGGDVIQDDSIIASYSKSWPKLIGLEMEIGGIAAGIHQTSDRPEFLAVKAVSDFGEDKHDPQVIPWRKYACHVSAAFILNLIRSGPAKELDEVEIRPSTTVVEERRRAAERKWEYVQDHEIKALAFFVLLKGPVGIGLFKNILREASIGFSDVTHSLESLISRLSVADTRQQSKSRHDGRFGYWNPYELDENYWVKRTSPDDSSIPETVSGIDAIVPWEMLGLYDVRTIRDLSRLPRIGASLPAQAFSVGVKEFEVRIVGDTFSFSVFMSDHGLEPLHHMARIQHVTVPRDKLMSLGMGMSGVELIQEFYEQFVEQSVPGTARRSNGRPRAGFGGVPGPGGREISFYPELPKGFFQTEESKAYSFKVKVPRRVDVEAETKAIRAQIEENPDNPEPVVRLAQLHVHEGRMLDALDAARRATILDPTYTDAHRLAGAILLDLDRAEEALPYLRTAVNLDPTSPQTRRALGDALDRTGEYLAAVDEFRSVIEADSADAKALRQLGFALIKAKQPDQALAPLARALELEPNDKFLMTILGSLYNQLGQPALGEPMLVQAAHIEPQDADDHLVLGADEFLRDRIDDAIREFRIAIEMEPDHQRAHNYLGQCLVERGQWDEAEGCFRRAVELDPTDAVSHANLGTVLVNQGHNDAGLRSLERAAELAPEDLSIREALERIRAWLKAEAQANPES